MKIAFLFPGQGSQFIGMGADIYPEFSIVREIFDMASEISKINLYDLCFRGPMEDLTRTVNLQPALTAVNLSFLAVIQKESIRPAFSAGHSLGEYSALNASEGVAREDAIRLVIKRGALMDREATRYEGAMSALVGLPIEAVQEIVDEVRQQGVVSVANHNTQLQIVITGAPEPVQKVSALARDRGAKAIPLKVSGAWHSELMRAAETEFKAFLGTIDFHAPKTPVLFNVTAASETSPEEIRSLMARQLCSPVRWYDIMQKMISESVDVFAEIGPGKVLTGLLAKTLPKDHPAKVFTINSLKSLEPFFKAVA